MITSFTSGWQKEGRAGWCAAARSMVFRIAKAQDAYELLCARVYPKSSEGNYSVRFFSIPRGHKIAEVVGESS